MRFGLDIDGTVTQMPDVFQAICRSLMRAGHHVYVVTAARPGRHNPDKNTKAGRQAELARYGMKPGIHFDDIVLAWGDDHRAVAEAKARICEELHLAVMFDNDPLNVAACREVTNVLVPSDDPPVYR